MSMLRQSEVPLMMWGLISSDVRLKSEMGEGEGEERRLQTGTNPEDQGCRGPPPEQQNFKGPRKADFVCKGTLKIDPIMKVLCIT